MLGEIHEREETAGRRAIAHGDGDAHPAEDRQPRPLRARLPLDRRRATSRSRASRADAVLLERCEWGNFYGTLVELRRGDDGAGQRPGGRSGRPSARCTTQKRDERAAIEALEKGAIGDVNYELEHLRLAERRLALDAPPAAERDRAARPTIDRAAPRCEAEYERARRPPVHDARALDAETLVMESADGKRKEIAGRRHRPRRCARTP